MQANVLETHCKCKIIFFWPDSTLLSCDNPCEGYSPFSCSKLKKKKSSGPLSLKKKQPQNPKHWEHPKMPNFLLSHGTFSRKILSAVYQKLYLYLISLFYRQAFYYCLPTRTVDNQVLGSAVNILPTKGRLDLKESFFQPPICSSWVSGIVLSRNYYYQLYSCNRMRGVSRN